LHTSARYLTPKYMMHFQCIGSSCEDTCCSWWEITIDKKTYDNYERLQDSSIMQKIDKLPPSRTNQTEYAIFEMDQKTGNCSMLCDGLCSIQAKLGESYLSQTCSTYPRVLNEFQNQAEVSALLSCPEVARLVLLREDSMDFVETDRLPTPNLRINKQQLKDKRKHQCLSALYQLIIKVLKDRLFSFQHRLILLGVLFDNISELFQEGKYDEVNDFLIEFKEAINTNSELRDYGAFPAQASLQFQFLNNTLMKIYNDYLWNHRYRRCINEYLKGIQINGSSLQESLQTYESGCSGQFAAYMNQNEHIMENYMLNHVFQNLFTDILDGEALFRFYVKLVVDYALIRLHLVGMASLHRELNDDMTIDLIQSYSKNYKFSKKFSDAFADEITKQGYYTLGFMSVLIK
jgi:lysine-N-methylase